MEKEQVDALVRERLVHEIHTSERKSFRGCRRRWDWIFHQYYYPKVTAKPLEFGVAFHEAMETLYDPDTWKFDRKIILGSAIQTFTEKCNEQKRKYLDHIEQYELDTEDAVEDYKERVDLGVSMLKFFAEKVMPDWDKHWTPRHVEIEFLVPIQDPDTDNYLLCTCVQCQVLFCNHMNAEEPDIDFAILKKKDGSGYALSMNGQGHIPWEGNPVVLAGRIDAIMEDAYGNLWITDWKTAAQLSKERGDEFLQLDDQISSYVMALRRKLGIDIKGFLYVEIRKAVPDAPARNQSRRLGRAFSVSKNQATTYDLYLATVKAEDSEAYEEGLYDEFLMFLQEEGAAYHWRYQVHKTDQELEQIERMLFNEASDMIDQNLRIYPNAGKFNCSYCAFRQPCMEMNRQGDVQYLLDEMYDKKTKHYWVKELSTDKQGGE